MTPHPQAELLRAIADGLLLERDTAFGNLEWEVCLPDTALALIAQGRDGELRIKPKTILIGGIEVPEPIRNTPELEAPYWLVDLSGEATPSGTWDNLVCERRWLRRGLLQATERGAKEMLDALTKQLGGNHV